MNQTASGIYLIINLVTFKRYVGSAKNLKQRFVDHKKLLRHNKHSNKHLQASWNKYGEENFKFEIVELVSDLKELIQIEQYYIDFFDSSNNLYGYNLAPKAGSSLGVKFSTESKLRISLAKKGKPSKIKGLKKSPEAVQKNREAHLLLYSDKTKHPWLGKRHSSETIEKMRQTKLGKSYPGIGIPVIVTKICKNCGKEFSRPLATGGKFLFCSLHCSGFYINKNRIHALIVPREIRICLCGCTQTFECKITSKKRFIFGHHTRMTECRKNMSKAHKNQKKHQIV